jgi:hypothetical protein
LLLTQVITAAAIQNLGNDSDIRLISKKFDNIPLYPQVSLNNVGNISSGLYGEEIDVHNNNDNNNESKSKLYKLLAKQTALAKQIGITEKDIKYASIAVANIIDKHKHKNRNKKSNLTRSKFKGCN